MKAMMHDITASFEQLMIQGGWTAKSWMMQAVEAIDEKFGKGYAKNNPALIGSFMDAAAIDMQSAMMVIAAEKIRTGLNEIAHAKEI
jgi:hypothetical protein